MNTENITPQILTTFQPGAILFDCYGYEQTNIDFYMIVKRVGNFVSLWPLEKIKSSEINFMTHENMPGNLKLPATPCRRKVKSFYGKEQGFSMRDGSGGGWVSLWDGKPKTSTHYA